MPTLVNIDKGEEKIDAFELFPPQEGELNLYYGKIRNGKNYACTVDIIERLERGSIEYVNWNINWQGYDQREKVFYKILGALGLKKHYVKFPKENLRFYRFEPDWLREHYGVNDFWEFLRTRTDCVVNVDEAYIPFDSYKLTKMSLNDRLTVLSTGHYNRTINVISQRPSGIHVVMRGNINRFFKIEKTFNGFWLFPPRFQKTEFQEMLMEMPDESKDLETGEYLKAESVQRYWGRKKIFNIYDTKYLRGDLPSSQPNLTEIHAMRYIDRVKLLKVQWRRKGAKSAEGRSPLAIPRYSSTLNTSPKSKRLDVAFATSKSTSGERV